MEDVRAAAPRRSGLRGRAAEPGPLPLHHRQHSRSAPGHLPPGDPPRRGRSRSDREPRPPAIRGRRDRIEPPEVAHELLAALPDSEKAFWAVALFGEISVERSWDPVKGPVDVKTGAGRRAVPMAFVVRRELKAHQQRTNRDGDDLVFGRTKTEAFFASTIRARANKAWTQAGLEPITPHEARHCAISYFIAA